jgi:hypothetical protein
MDPRCGSFESGVAENRILIRLAGFILLRLTAQVDRPNRGTDDEGGTEFTKHVGADQRVAVGSASNRVLGAGGHMCGHNW